MGKTVAIIGGGVAGMEAASNLAKLGLEVTLIENGEKLGGHLLLWDRLFPTRRPGKEVLEYLRKGLDGNISIKLNAQVLGIRKGENKFQIDIKDEPAIGADALLLATGFDLFEAWRKEEYGYGIYENVITAAELEAMFASGSPLLTTTGKMPARVGFIHCVGSRDEKTGNLYCSRVCCVTAVKQAIEIKEILPRAEVFCFYMDLRMFGMGFEELYKEAQEKWGIQFIRGRLSEAFENIDKKILLKVEDTLAGRPLRLTVDLLVLMTGFVPSAGTLHFGKMLDLDFEESRFLKPADMHTAPNMTHVRGVFIAGACSSPKSIEDTIADARSAALSIVDFLIENERR